MTKKSTTALVQGDTVLTTDVVGSDFGLPLVQPWVERKRQPTTPHERLVRNHCRVSGGTVVWFMDGTKSPPIHGRTAWLCP